MSTTMNMLAINVPLSQWRDFEAGTRTRTSFHGGKNNRNTALAIFNQLSHPETVLLVAREFDLYSADVRLQLRTLCNDANCTGNVRKGVQKLDRLMGGKLLREEKFVEQHRVMGQHGWTSRSVNPAVAGATRKYGTK